MADKKINILFARQEIAERTKLLGKEISEFYKDKPLTVIVLANGGIFFAADLTREIHTKSCWIDLLALGSYVNDRKSGIPQFRCPEKLDPAGRHILLVDDIFDSGESIKVCTEYFRQKGACSVRCAVLADKAVPGRAAKPDWSCFEVPDVYLIGCGMDSNEEYRNMDCIAFID